MGAQACRLGGRLNSRSCRSSSVLLERKMADHDYMTQTRRKASAVRRNWNVLGEQINGLIKCTERLATKLSETQRREVDERYPGLNFPTLVDVLLSFRSDRKVEWAPSVLATSGSGPWSEEYFDSLLVTEGIEPKTMPAQDVNGLVLGVYGWNEEDVANQIRGRDPNSLRIYTQEIFLVGLLVGQDPYIFLEQEAIEETGLAHPGIQFVLRHDFPWPWPEDIEPVNDSTSDSSLDSDEDFDYSITENWATESTLRQMGYSASTSGPDDFQRRAILKRVFEASHLPGVDPSEQEVKWGPPRSGRRLLAMSRFLSWLISFQGSERPSARAKWASDLEWLRKEFYVHGMRFRWPATDERPGTQLSPAVAWPFPTSRPR